MHIDRRVVNLKAVGLLRPVMLRRAIHETHLCLEDFVAIFGLNCAFFMRNPEIEKLHEIVSPFFGEESNVIGFDVSVDDPLFVGSLEDTQKLKGG